jgi:hypothetical protein
MAMKWGPHKKYGLINLGLEPTNCKVLQDLISNNRTQNVKTSLLRLYFILLPFLIFITQKYNSKM